MELFISDLDGTLLNGNAEVTEFTRDTLNRLMAKGLNFRHCKDACFRRKNTFGA